MRKFHHADRIEIPDSHFCPCSGVQAFNADFGIFLPETWLYDGFAVSRASADLSRRVFRMNLA